MKKQAQLLMNMAGSARPEAATVISRLLSLGTPVNCSDVAGFTPLAAASRIGNVKAVSELLSARADPQIASRENQNPPLFWAAGSGHLAVVKLLVEAKAVRAARARATCDHFTPHVQAALSRAAPPPAHLRRAGRAPAQRLWRHDSALMWSSRSGAADVTRWLLEESPELLDAVNQQKFTALMCASAVKG